MRLDIKLTIDEAECEALVCEEDGREIHFVGVTTKALMHDLERYITKRLDQLEISQG